LSPHVSSSKGKNNILLSSQLKVLDMKAMNHICLDFLSPCFFFLFTFNAAKNSLSEYDYKIIIKRKQKVRETERKEKYLHLHPGKKQRRKLLSLRSCMIKVYVYVCLDKNSARLQMSPFRLFSPM